MAVDFGAVGARIRACRLEAGMSQERLAELSDLSTPYVSHIERMAKKPSLNMIKMLVVPMVFFSITAGVASLSDLRKLRNIGVKVVGLYAVTSAISVGIGLLVANIINPGKGFDMSALSGGAQYDAQGMPSVLDTLIDMFPTNVVQSFANQNMLQIIVFSIFLGVALIMLEERGKHLAGTFQSLADVMYKITAIVMEFSPIGVCALLADSVGVYGLSIFGPLGKLILTVYAADVILVLAMYVPMVALMAKFPLKQFFKGIWKVWVITVSTTSSAGSLPVTTSVTNDNFGVSPELSSFSLPLGATIDMADTVFNVTGDVVTTMVVARSENMIQPPVPAGKD